MTLIQLNYNNQSRSKPWEIWYQTSAGRRKLMQKFGGKKAALDAAFFMLTSNPNFFKIDINKEYLKGYSV